MNGIFYSEDNFWTPQISIFDGFDVENPNLKLVHTSLNVSLTLETIRNMRTN